MKKQKSRQGSQRRPKESDARSVSTYDGDSRFFSDASGVPVRPPRRKNKKSSRGVSGSESSVAGSILQRRKSVRSSVRSNRSNRSIRSSRRGGGTRSGPVSYNPSGPPSFVSDHPFRRSGQLKRMNSRGQADFARRSSRRASKRYVPNKTPGFMTGGNTAGGDVYTRVAIPRSKSFMNVNSQYNLQELFKELKEKEGVESIDDVLKKIISPNGISFNEIKPVYRELLLKLAMTMSQDELFQRSKNIMSLKTQEKQKKSTAKSTKSTTKSNKSKSKDKYPVSASEHSTLSSFLKLTFSSSKQHQHADGKSSSSNKNGGGIAKTDISGPIPIHPPPSLGGGGNGKTPKTTRKATSPLPPPPQQQPSNNKKSFAAVPHHHPPSRNAQHLPPPSKKAPPSPPDDFIDDAYVSCSECGTNYESVCTYDTCSCANDKIPPPKAYQTSKHHQHTSSNNNPSSTSNKAAMRGGHSMSTTPDDIESVVHDCDTDSCISSEKCYCSLRHDPRAPLASTMSKSRPSLGLHQPHHHSIVVSPSDSESCCTSASHFTSEMSDSATDTTCYSVRQVPLHQHHAAADIHADIHMSLSGIETPQTAWRRNSKAATNTCCINGDCSDTYSDAGVILNSGSSASTSSGAGSCKCDHHCQHALSRKNSGGSGYQSNDSCCSGSSHHHGGHGGHGSPIPRLPPSVGSITSCNCTNACSSCATSLAGSLMSNRRSRPKLSLPASHSHINLSAAGLGSPMERSSQARGRSMSPQKVLVVSAVDKAGKVCNILHL